MSNKTDKAVPVRMRRADPVEAEDTVIVITETTVVDVIHLGGEADSVLVTAARRVAERWENVPVNDQSSIAFTYQGVTHNFHRAPVE